MMVLCCKKNFPKNENEVKRVKMKINEILKDNCKNNNTDKNDLTFDSIKDDSEILFQKEKNVSCKR